MGFFGTFLFDGHSWISLDPEVSPPNTLEHWLHLDIHDSDITTITYRPAQPGTGTAFLGQTPRTYFEDPQASAPTDIRREAAGLAAWWADQRGGSTDDERDAMAATLTEYLAADHEPAELDLDEEVDELDDGEVFVEVKTARFLKVLGLPVPDQLSPRIT